MCAISPVYKMKFINAIETVVPTKIVGPIAMNYKGIFELINVPVATYESPVWHSIKRGALVSERSESGITVHILQDVMSRSVILEAENLSYAVKYKQWIDENFGAIRIATNKTSDFIDLQTITTEIVGKLLYVRLSFTTGNASGHNMVTKASDAFIDIFLSHCQSAKYVSISGNYCSDKKVSAVNGILGRGKRVSAELIVPENVCKSLLKASPEQLIDINMKKNLIGSILSGGIRSANAHFANTVLAIFLATGQDGANVVEASQGVTFVDSHKKDLYFSVNIPNIIVGTVGSGKDIDFVKKNLELLGCNGDLEGSAARLSAIIAATVLCSELSLMAAQVNRGELTASHMRLERNSQ